MDRCLFCYKELLNGEHDFHESCVRKMFRVNKTPIVDYTRADMDELAMQIIQSQTTLTGVQAKISLHLNQHEGSARLTIVGLWGKYIFKPQTDLYPFLPEVEDLTMHLAEASDIQVVSHSLIRLKDGELGYITGRIDRRVQGDKIAMEDFCQLSERQTEYKYRSSHEKVAKVLKQYSSVPTMDIVRYWEVVLFCFLTGNNDMHLKNFSLYNPDDVGFVLTPAYDLLNVTLVNPKDTEELALTLNGKKSRLTKEDFVVAMTGTGLLPKVVDNIFRKFEKVVPSWKPIIQRSFLPKEMQDRYWEIVEERSKRLFGEDVK